MHVEACNLGLQVFLIVSLPFGPGLIRLLPLAFLPAPRLIVAQSATLGAVQRGLGAATGCVIGWRDARVGTKGREHGQLLR